MSEEGIWRKYPQPDRKMEYLKQMKEAIKELINIMEEFVGNLHDVVRTDCISSPDRCPAFINKLIRLTERLMLLQEGLK